MSASQRIRAEVLWAYKRMSDLVRKNLTTPFRELPTELSTRVTHVRRHRDLWVPMRDGVRLCADVYLPDGAGPFPTILIRMPYGKREAYCYMPAHGKFWARLGYACVVQDVRGRWDSEGTYEPFIHESDDGWDTLDWVARQPWCNGRIGMTGESYYGYTQWAVAGSGHPNLVCAAPGDTAADIYGSWAYVDNAFCQQTMGGWTYVINEQRDVNEYRWDPWHLPLETATDAAGHASRTHKEWITNPCRNGYWDRINKCATQPEIVIPMLHWGGWYDTFLTGTIGGWQGVRSQSRDPAARRSQRLCIAGTDHEMTPEFTGVVGPHRLQGHGYAHDRVARFMDEWLADGKTGRSAAAADPVRYFTLVANEWRTASDWPPPGIQERRYYLRGAGHATGLSGDGALTTEAPGSEPPDTYRYDPDDPVTYWLGCSLWEAAHYLHDRRPVESREDVLVYTSDALTQDMEITGPISATLHVSTTAATRTSRSHSSTSSRTATPTSCRRASGAFAIASRMSRNPCQPGATYEISRPLGDELSHRARSPPAGRGLEQQLRPLRPQPQHGRGTRTGGATRRATQTLYHDASSPSFVTLPVVPE